MSTETYFARPRSRGNLSDARVRISADAKGI
jgi:hypothetical protein